ncbi:hypothetical protein M1L60_11025 [Actinoplanes sp. TRM 88003]|uniref:HIT domain-containing protein n=1 Tax=Paractinoplanes aksuensis TaxID=2939490 RepID=A0ABT1DK00_9ACTN|nr:HIT domain-containing protein [Actinoplanes aksuensis]MCO8271125.1 hypothetical protein [Actinoplanes aksuensis]
MALKLNPDTVIAVEPLWTLSVNWNQNLIGKTMLVANRPVESVTALSPDEWTDLRTQIARLTAAVSSLFAPDQFNHAFLMNANAQVHLHVVPRYRSPRNWQGHTFVDPHFGELYGKEQQILDGPDLALLTRQIRERLTRGGLHPVEKRSSSSAAAQKAVSEGSESPLQLCPPQKRVVAHAASRSRAER